ncbi:MAG TPA: hemolysin family protein [Hyphomicrobium zavarzinii]|uniref:hemolysin family protein n=1 Tax=Hyphomicrobium sp. DMF-1 TaxID=3019544 RepID=UPI0022EBE7FC|nr:hemolysin family protein [Hyphomicrobium sp. DMF-1]WBT40219.1 hemolysin family protein [Hyphomicrobium sp. DMF-1]HML44008.1 hemolysin family protein [Hyphomicrobium zavarzinii]
MTELLIVTALILLNGLFALSELAVVSSRQPRLKALAASGHPGAKRALALSADPGRFLSAVQIGITLIGIINGAYSGETFGEYAYTALREAGLPDAVAAPLGYGTVIAVITYLSVIIGELVPKNIALRNAERIACAVAPAMAAFSSLARPAVWLLDTSTRLVFRVFGQKEASESQVSDEEISIVIAEAEAAGVLESHEREMISGVMRLGDRTVVGLMTPRTDVDWIDISLSTHEIREQLIETPHSLIPVGEGSVDQLVGIVRTRELLAAILAGKPLDIRSHLRKVPIIPETMDALDALNVLREADVPIALIHDEYGHFEGLVTPADVLEAIVGVFKSDSEEPNATQRDDGSWLLSGSMPADEMADLLGFPLPERRPYATVAGLVLAELQHIPKTGEKIRSGNWLFEVVDLDGRRIDKVLASRMVPETV